MAGIYIHVPFCRQACNYCNFYFTLGKNNKDAFVEALLKEVTLTRNYVEGESIDTIYIGGGTPTLLDVTDLQAIIDKVRTTYQINQLAELTIEANPDDLTPEKITGLKQLIPLGLNRFSIGVQSFFDTDLRYMNRAHTSAEALEAIMRVQNAGFENITIDLIYGTPTMTDEQWMHNLITTFELQIPHVSSYALTVEPHTTLEKRIQRGDLPPVADDHTAEQFTMLQKQMQQHGYQQYEISNFALPGRHAIHNSNYWLGKKYLGLGPSAHSFNGKARRWNIANNLHYIKSINQGMLPFEEEVLTPVQLINERIMTLLRTQQGLNLLQLTVAARQLVLNNLAQVNPEYYTLQEQILCLTNPGKLFADHIAAQLFIEEGQLL